MIILNISATSKALQFLRKLTSEILNRFFLGAERVLSLLVYCLIKNVDSHYWCKWLFDNYYVVWSELKRYSSQRHRALLQISEVFLHFLVFNDLTQVTDIIFIKIFIMFKYNSVGNYFTVGYRVQSKSAMLYMW